jgi:predicted ATP-dependent endonuclease of OLD family
LGVDVAQMTTSIDFKDISLKDNRVCLHDAGSIPYRLKGKGIKRLISIAIQSALVDNSGIVLIDEVEQGLEPDRVQHLVNSLKMTNKGQVFITTHSSNVLVELNATDLFLLRKGSASLVETNSSLQGCIRANPAAFFANKLIICEGLTEIGICRAINLDRISKGKKSVAYSGVVLVDGTGSNFVEYCRRFVEMKFPICIFCDSDDSGINKSKNELRQLGATIVDCDEYNCIEFQIFKDLPWNGVKKLLDMQIELKDFESIKTSLETQYGSILPNNWENFDSPKIRDAIMKAATYKKPKNKGGYIDKSWYKRIDHGETLGSILCQYLDQMGNKKIKTQVEILSNWMD